MIRFLTVLFFLGGAITAQEVRLYGELEVTGDPSIGSVRINDSSMAFFDGMKLTLATGPYRIRATGKKGIDGLRYDFDETVIVQYGQVTRVQIYLDQYIFVNSIPGGASVSSGDSTLGITPISAPLSFLNGRSLVFRLEGYLPETAVVGNSSVMVNLQPESLTRRKNPNQFTNQRVSEYHSNKYKKWILANTIIGITSGMFAAYYKNKADRTFEDAKLARRNGELDKVNRLTKKTDKYDRYAIIGFIGLQVNAGSLIYFLIKSK